MVSTEILEKPYGRLVLPDEDGTYTAEIVEFPGCIASGNTMAEALANLEEVAVDWIAAALEQGQAIPEPLEAAGYSGKLVVRMPKSLHQKAAFWAEREGVSLNLFIVNCLAEHVGQRARPLFSQLLPSLGSARVDVQVTTMVKLTASKSRVFISPQQRAISSDGSWHLRSSNYIKEISHA